MIPESHFAEAVALACPGRPFKCDPESYEGLTMLDGESTPSLEEIEAAWAARPAPVPESITPRQLRLWLAQNSLLDAAKAYVNGIADAAARLQAQIEWDYSLEIRREHPLVAAIGGALSLTETEIDEAFEEAAAL